MPEQHGHILQNLSMDFDDEYGLQITDENEYSFPLLPDRVNWSTIDIDAPYSRCSVLDSLVPFTYTFTPICSQCVYIHNFLESVRNP